MFIGFAIKIPSFPFHTWLPDAHVEAPTPISMILAGVLLKMGGYGLIRIAYPFFPHAARGLRHLITVLSVIAIIYGAFVAMAQTDFKRLDRLLVGEPHGLRDAWALPRGTEKGINGAMYMMLAHGTISAMLFMIVGVIYDRAHHREIARFGGLAWVMPKYFLWASIALLREPRPARLQRFRRRDHDLRRRLRGTVSHVGHRLAGRGRHHGGLLPTHAAAHLSGRHARDLS